MSDSVTVLLQAPGDAVRMEQRMLKVDIGDGPVERSALFHRSSNPAHVLYEFGATGDDLLRLSTTSKLHVSGPGLRLTVTLAGLDQVLGSLGDCIADLLVRWGLSKSDQARLASFPQPASGPNFSSFDYPQGALARNAIGSVEARVTVHADGSASDCRMVRSSGHKEIDEITCRKALAMRFRPARDHNGDPLVSPFYIHVRWMIDKNRISFQITPRSEKEG